MADGNKFIEERSKSRAAINKRVRTHEYKVRLALGSTNGYADNDAVLDEIEAIRVLEEAFMNQFERVL